MSTNQIEYIIAGDSGLIMKFGDIISEDIHEKIYSYCGMLKHEGIEGVYDIVPTYATIMVCYDPTTIDYHELVHRIKEMKYEPGSVKEKNVIDIPTLYGGEMGMDLEKVAKHNGLTSEEVIKIHSGRQYLIYMLGFSPGFPYLGGMDGRIATPRLINPRQKIEAGSVGIAGNQTGIYPVASPGGWQIIGRTPIRLFTPEKELPTLLRAGDYIRFKPIDATTFKSLL